MSVDDWRVVQLSDPDTHEAAVADFRACEDVRTVSLVFEGGLLATPPQELVWYQCLRVRPNDAPVSTIRVNPGVCQQLQETSPGVAAPYQYAYVEEIIGPSPSFTLKIRYDYPNHRWPTDGTLVGKRVFFRLQENPHGQMPRIVSITDVDPPSLQQQIIKFDPAGDPIPDVPQNHLLYPAGNCKSDNWGPQAQGFACPAGQCSNCPGYVSGLYPVRADIPTSQAVGFGIENAWGTGPSWSNTGRNYRGVALMMAHEDSGVLYTHRDYGGPPGRDDARTLMQEGTHPSLVLPRRENWQLVGDPYSQEGTCIDTIRCHGTQTSSIIVARPGAANHDILGIAPGLLFMNYVGVTSPSAWVIDGAVANGVSVISFSLRQGHGPTEAGSAQGIATANAVAAGVMVLQGHNDNANQYNRALWTKVNCGQAMFGSNRDVGNSSVQVGGSSWGDNIDLLPVGQALADARWPDNSVTEGFWETNGESISTPFAGGIAALLMARNLTWKVNDVRRCLHVATKKYTPDMGSAKWTQFYGWGQPRADLGLARCIYQGETLRPTVVTDISSTPDLNTTKPAYAIDGDNATSSLTTLGGSFPESTVFAVNTWPPALVTYKYLALRIAYRVDGFQDSKQQLQFEWISQPGGPPWTIVKPWFTPQNGVAQVEGLVLPAGIVLTQLWFRIRARATGGAPGATLKVFEISSEGTEGSLELELLYPTVAENPDGIATTPDRAVDRRTQSYATVNVPEGGIVPVEKTGILLKTWDRRNALLSSISAPAVVISYATVGFAVNQIRWEYNAEGGWFPLGETGWETPQDDRYLRIFSLPVPYAQVSTLEIRLRTNSGDSGEAAKVFVFGAWIEGAHRAAAEFFSPGSFDDFGGATQNGTNALDQDVASYATASFDISDTKNILLLAWSAPEVRSASFVKSTLTLAYSASGFNGNSLKIEYSTTGGASWTALYLDVPTNAPPEAPITLSFDVADPPQGIENVRIRISVVGGEGIGQCTLRIHEVWLEGQFISWDRQIGALPPADFRYEIEPVRNVHLRWENHVMTLLDAELDIGHIEVYRSSQGWIVEAWGNTPVYDSRTAPSKHEFLDMNLAPGTYYYTIFAVDRNGQYSEAVEYAKPTSQSGYASPGSPEFPRLPVQVV